MPERYSSEYWQKFNGMPRDQQVQLEKEWHARDNGQDAPPAPEKPQTDPLAAPLPGDKPKAEAEVFITQEALDKLPPEAKQVIEAMQAHIDETAPLMGQDFTRGLQTFMEDPFIKQRMEEIASGQMYTPKELTKGFKADTYLTQEAMQGIDFIGDPEGSAAKVNALLQKAHEDGAKTGQMSERYENQQKVAFAERKATFIKGFGDLTLKHAELKPKDPTVKDVTDKRHPVNVVLKWASANLGDRFFLNTEGRNPFDSAYAAFLADGGKLDEAISNTVVSSNLKFIRGIKEGLAHAATVGRDTSGAPLPRTSPVPNLDVERYMSDPAYAASVFNNADPATRLKLEKIRNGETVKA